jgi:hypothetical protein
MSYEQILAHVERHNIREALMHMCEREDAQTIRGALRRLSDGQLNRRFARMLAKESREDR